MEVVLFLPKIWNIVRERRWYPDSKKIYVSCPNLGHTETVIFKIYHKSTFNNPTDNNALNSASLYVLSSTPLRWFKFCYTVFRDKYLWLIIRTDIWNYVEEIWLQLFDVRKALLEDLTKKWIKLVEGHETLKL